MDLLVMAVAHGAVTIWVWFQVYRKSQTPMLTFSFQDEALKLLREGQANWLFGVAYNALTLFGLILIPILLPKDSRDLELGYFRGSNQLAHSPVHRISYSFGSQLLPTTHHSERSL